MELRVRLLNLSVMRIVIKHRRVDNMGTLAEGQRGLLLKPRTLTLTHSVQWARVRVP